MTCGVERENRALHPECRSLLPRRGDVRFRLRLVRTIRNHNVMKRSRLRHDGSLRDSSSTSSSNRYEQTVNSDIVRTRVTIMFQVRKIGQLVTLISLRVIFSHRSILSEIIVIVRTIVRDCRRSISWVHFVHVCRLLHVRSFRGPNTRRPPRLRGSGVLCLGTGSVRAGGPRRASGTAAGRRSPRDRWNGKREAGACAPFRRTRPALNCSITLWILSGARAPCRPPADGGRRGTATENRGS